MNLHTTIIEQGWNILLASQSPRRQELLAGCDIPFKTISIDVDELYPAELDAEDVPLYLARLKSEGYTSPMGERDIVITADTVVIRNGDILGKPTDRDDAIDMLTSLSGQQHTVITGVSIRTKEQRVNFSSHTKVQFAQLSRSLIEYYVDRYQPYDKAGSYGCQEWLGYAAIERIEGSFYNVMGLPTERLYHHLSEIIVNTKCD